MGFFDGDEVVTAGVSATPLFDGDIPNLINQAVLQAVLSPGDVTAYMIEANLHNYATDIDKYLTYGKGDYYYGLPSGTVGSQNLDRDAVIDILTTAHNKPIVLNAILLETPQENYYAYDYLQANYAWTYKENILIGTGSFDRDETVIASSYNSSTNKIEIIVEPIDYQSQEHYDYYTKILVSLDPQPTRFYYQGVYHIDEAPSGPDDLVFFFYDPEDHTYPILDLPDPTAIATDFYPIAPIRLNKENIIDSVNTTKVDSVKKLLSYANVDLASITDSINGHEHIETIDDAYVLFGMDIYTDTEVGAKYLYKYFEMLKGIASIWKTLYDSYSLVSTNYKPIAAPPVNSFYLEETELHVQIQFNYIDITVKSGTVSDAYSKVIHYVPETYWSPSEWEIGVDNKTYKYVNSYVVINKKIDETSYYQMIVHGLRHTSKVLIAGSNYKYIIRDLNVAWADTQLLNGFYIPVIPSILKTFSVVEEEKMLYESLQLVIASIEITELEWYESDFFGTLVKIVMTFVGAITGQYYLAGVIQAAQAAGTSVLMAVVKVFAEAIILKILTTFISKEIGGLLGAVVSVIAAYVVSNFSGGTLGVKGLPFSDQLLSSLSVFTDSYTMSLDYELQAISSDMDDLLELNKERETEIERVHELLDTNSGLLDPLYILKQSSKTDLSESPSDFFDRTIHSGNVGVESLGAIEDYVSNLLLLPEVGEQLI